MRSDGKKTGVRVCVKGKPGECAFFPKAKLKNARTYARIGSSTGHPRIVSVQSDGRWRMDRVYQKGKAARRGKL
jgi:hypothetical protein